MSRLLSATLSNIASGFAGQLLLFVSGPLVARLLGVEGRGLFAVINVWSAMLTFLGSLGIPMSCTYYLSGDDTNPSEVITESYRLMMLQTAVLMPALGVILWLVSGSVPGIRPLAVFPTVLIVPSLLLQLYAQAVLQGRQMFTVLSVARLAPVLLYAGGAVILFLLDIRSLAGIVYVWVLANGLAGILMTAAALRDVGSTPRAGAETRRNLLSFGLKGHLGALRPIDAMRLDQVVASVLLPASSLGIYAVAYAFTNLPLFVSQGAGMVAFPAIARKGLGAASLRILRKYLSGVAVLNLLLAGILIVLMPLLIPLLFGAEFAGSIPIAQILLVGSFLSSLTRILTDGLRGLGRPQVATAAEVLLFAWLMTAGVFLIVRHGTSGLAVGVTAGHGLSLAFSWLFRSRVKSP